MAKEDKMKALESALAQIEKQLSCCRDWQRVKYS